ncbi:MAG: YceI family protein [Burkholderiales bacterium]
MRARTLAPWVMLAALAGGAACADDWDMAPAASHLEFVATYERTPVPGAFPAFDARIRFDPARLDDSRIDVVVDVARADMHSADINKAIMERDWFDVARFPRATFHATSVRGAGPGRFVAGGTLELKGVTAPVDVPFTWTPDGAGAVMAGDLAIERARFGIGQGEWAAGNVIGPRVSVKFSVALRHKG